MMVSVRTSNVPFRRGRLYPVPLQGEQSAGKVLVFGCLIMRLGKVALEKLKEPGNSIGHWRNQVEEHGVEHVKKLLEPPLPVSAVWPTSARQAIKEHENGELEQRVREEQANERAKRQRDDDAVEVGREANSIARTGNRETRNAWLVAFFVGVAIIAVTIWVALGSQAS